MNGLMTKAEFARLCQVSQAMVSKYADALVMRGKLVDARASLAQIDGRLDPGKHRAALDKLDAPNVVDMRPPAPDSDAPDPGDGPEPGEPGEPVGWKARYDMFRAKEAELGYHERVGALVDANEIAAAVESVIADFWTETERSVKIDAAEIASELKLDAERASKLRSMLLRKNRDMRANFARVCRDSHKRYVALSGDGAQAVA